MTFNKRKKAKVILEFESLATHPLFNEIKPSEGGAQNDPILRDAENFQVF